MINAVTVRILLNDVMCITWRQDEHVNDLEATSLPETNASSGPSSLLSSVYSPVDASPIFCVLFT